MSKTYSCILVGLEVVEIEIETIVGSGFSGLHILGLKNDISKDMRERIRAAMESIGIPIPAKRVVVNLSSYEILRLSRSSLHELDFAVAAAVILALFKDQNIYLSHRDKEYFAGELTLGGLLKPVQNTLIYEKLIYEKKIECFSISNCEKSSKNEKFDHYVSLLDWLNERKHTKTISKNNLEIIIDEPNYQPSRQQIEYLVKEIKTLLHIPKLCVAIMVAAIGHHHILLSGEPGIGKTFATKKILEFCRPLKNYEKINLELIYSSKIKIHQRPMRMPHHSCSVAALIGGQLLKPGEATLAHHGVLFLDEIAEFSKNALEALREPLDVKCIELSKALGSVTYPAHFLLCATSNPCPCGYQFSFTKPCRCMPHESKKYLSKISGPLLDRFDLKLWVQKEYIAEKDIDIFSEYLMNMSETDLNQFAENFLYLQRTNQLEKIDSNSYTIDDDDITKNMNEYHKKYFKEKTSLRGKYQIKRLQNTFRNLFPNLVSRNDFTNDIFKYRNFMQMLENDLTR